MEEIKQKLDKIIELLELRNSIAVARNQMLQGVTYLKPTEFLQELGDTTDHYGGTCICGDHKHGESTGGWHCPVHGQCF